MSKRRKTPAKQPTTRSAARASLAAPLSLIALAMVLSIFGLLQARSVWLDLPSLRLQHLDHDAVSEAFRASRSALQTEAMDALLLEINSNDFTAAWQSPRNLPEALENTRARVSRLTRSQLGRLQLAALIIRELEHDGVPTDAWWPRLEAYLTGLERASFAHHMTAIIEADAAVYEEVGLRPGAALRVAHLRSGSPHGPFLQYFVKRITQLADEQRERGQVEESETCGLIVHRLLQEWVLEPGPLQLRLLAAELLANTLETSPDTADAAEARMVAEQLREWRHLCRTGLAERPMTLAALNLTREPETSPDQYRSAIARLALVTWLLGATAAAGAWVIAALAMHLIRRMRPGLSRSAGIGGAVLAVAIACLGVVWPWLLPSAFDADCRRAATDQVGWPWHPFVAAAIVVVFIPVIARLIRAPAQWWSRRTAVGIFAWLTLGVVLLGTGRIAQHALARYDAHVATALRAWAGPAGSSEDARLLQPLRNWLPR